MSDAACIQLCARMLGKSWLECDLMLQSYSLTWHIT